VSTIVGASGTRLVVRERRAGELELEALAREAGVHPELVRKLVILGLLEQAAAAHTDRILFPRDAAPRIARAVRLRRDLGLNFAGAILAGELLDRIEQLEQQLRRADHADRQRR